MFYLLMVLFGVHHVLIPISQALIEGTSTSGVGYSILVPVQLMAGAAEVGAAIYFIMTTKNKKNTPERLERKKYNPYLRKVTIHREIK